MLLRFVLLVAFARGVRVGLLESGKEGEAQQQPAALEEPKDGLDEQSTDEKREVPEYAKILERPGRVETQEQLVEPEEVEQPESPEKEEQLEQPEVPMELEEPEEPGTVMHRVRMRVKSVEGRKVLFGCTTSDDAHVLSIDAASPPDDKGWQTVFIDFREKDGVWTCRTKLDMSDIQYDDAVAESFLCEVRCSGNSVNETKKGDNCEIEEVATVVAKKAEEEPVARNVYKAVLVFSSKPLDSVLCQCFVGAELVFNEVVSGEEEGAWTSVEAEFEASDQDPWVCSTQLDVSDADPSEIDEEDCESVNCQVNHPDSSHNHKGANCKIEVFDTVAADTLVASTD